MLSARLALREEDVVRLSLEFLHNRELHISQLSIERETGVINGQYSDDVLFLRQLILDGQWDDVIEFIQPLEALQAFDMKRFRYSILRHKFIELLCIKSEAGGALIAAGQGLNSVDGAVEEVVQVLEDLEKLSPTKDEYSGLCLLLTLPRLADHLQYRNWNPSFGRVQCFQDVFPLVEKFLPGEKKTPTVSASKNDRLIQLVIKGVLYESCVTYCQAKATGTAEGTAQEMTFSKLLDGSVGFSDSDLSLLSWLQSIPAETFSVPFEQKTLNVDVERLERPSLETSWTEHMLITPIKPKTFPHSVMPFTRPRSAADIMTRSLLPTLDGLPYGLNQSQTNTDGSAMSRSSFASFHLTGIKPSSGKMMTSSVDRLFENEGEAFVSSKYNDFNQGLSSIQEIASVQSKSPEPHFQNLYPKPISLVEQTGRESPSTTPSTAKSSRRDSLSERVVMPSQIQQMTQPPPPHPMPTMNLPVKNSPGIGNDSDSVVRNSSAMSNNAVNSNGGELFEKFQRQKLNRENGSVNGNKLNQSNDSVPTANNKSNCDIEASILKKESTVDNSQSNGRLNADEKKSHHQLKQLESLFTPSSSSKNEVSFIESQRDINCDIHGGRASSPFSTSASKRGSTVSLYNGYRKESTPSLDYVNGVQHRNKRDSVDRSLGSNDVVERRKSFADSRNVQAANARKRNSWNTSMFKGLEHPSAFPSMLRSTTTPSQSQIDLRNSAGTPTNKSEPYVSHTIPRRRNSAASNFSNRRDSTMSIDRRYSNVSNTSLDRRNSFGSTLGRGDSLDLKMNNSTRRDNFNNDTRKQSYGSSIYLRPDSSGTTNLIRRDSFGSQGIRKDSFSTIRTTSPFPRDYVSKTIDGNLLTSSTKHEPNSILRKNLSKDDNFNRLTNKENVAHKLTAANLTKHVTILENNGNDVQENGTAKSTDGENTSSYSGRDRRDSSGSMGSYLASRRISVDSLDARKHSHRRASYASVELDGSNGDWRQVNAQNDPNRPRFVAVTALEDVQAVRCAEFHPNGQVYSVGSNSKTFRICEYPSLSEVREDHTTYQPTVLFKRTKHHKGSIYCMAWSPQGDLVATGSNDKTVKLMRYNEVLKQLEGKETELTMHDGTVRDLCFLEDSTNKTSLLISGGAGDCKVYVTDCATATPFQALSGHGGHILSLYNWGGAMFVSGSQDKSVRFWDLRTRGCVNTVTPATVPGSRQGSPVAAVCVDPSGRLLVSGHEDSSCVLYDIRGNRPIQCFKPHASDIRSIRFSPSAYYLLTGGYDNKLVLTDLQGDLTMPLPSVVVAQHTDKVISGRWHPTDFSFISTSADKTATLWALPPI